MRHRTTLIYVLVGATGLVLLSLALQPTRRAAHHAQAQVARKEMDVRRDNAQLQALEAAPMAPETLPRPEAQGAPPLTASMVNPAVLQAMEAGSKLIRTGQLAIDVSAFDEAFGKLQRIVEENGGYVANLSANRRGSGMAQGTVQVRVVPSRYFQTLDALRTLGQVTSESVSTQDITREFADLEARLKHKREVESRMREIFKGRATTMESLIQVERELATVTEEIERMEGERRYFQQVTSLSTLTVELREHAAPTSLPQPGIWFPIQAALRDGVASLLQLMGSLLYALILVGPFALLGWLGWRRFRRLHPKATPISA